jgi:hypothetical protein
MTKLDAALVIGLPAITFACDCLLASTTVTFSLISPLLLHNHFTILRDTVTQ